MIKYSVCVATYKRPELLGKLITSLLDQKNIDLDEMEIIVVDNDSGGSARTTVESFAAKKICAVQYDIQPEKNISLTRNLAVSQTKGEYILFIDDDEYADEKWIYAHITNLKKYRADGAFGKVVFCFPDCTPEWIRNCYVYQHKVNPSGHPPALLMTTNSIVKSKFFHTDGFWFDPEYGLTGGEDHELFSRMKIDNAKFISCQEAVTYESVPKHRANVKWLIRRVFRTGNNYTRTLINFSGKRSFVLSISELLIGSAQAYFALMLSLFFIWDKTKSLNWFLKSVSNFSKPLAVFGFYPQEYKNNPKSTSELPAAGKDLNNHCCM